VPECHHGEGDEVGGERLLDLQLGRAEFFGDFVERRQVGVDREGPERRKGGEQEGDAALFRLASWWG
jgi:hypothetical protein